jgi:hypothetical protein
MRVYMIQRVYGIMLIDHQLVNGNTGGWPLL